jgi:hypothetical protein
VVYDHEGRIHMQSPLDSILASLTVEHGRALEWFVEHEGEIGPRPWRQHGRSVVPGVSMAMTAERGIHKPAELQWALSIGATRDSLYMDGSPTPVDEHTWVLPYRAHEGADGTGYDSPWNRALLRNVRDRIPVGVFLPADEGTNLNLGLAMPEDYDPSAGTFLLRGPMRHSQSVAVWESVPEAEDEIEVALHAEEEPTSRTMTLVLRRRAQDAFRESLLQAYGRSCCVTQYDAEEALQAAHILSYSGRSSQLPQNGLLLRADLHLLFDRHLIGIDPGNLRVSVSPRLKNTRYNALSGSAVSPTVDSSSSPDPKRLAVHWAVFSGEPSSQTLTR